MVCGVYACVRLRGRERKRELVLEFVFVFVRVRRILRRTFQFCSEAFTDPIDERDVCGCGCWTSYLGLAYLADCTLKLTRRRELPVSSRPLLLLLQPTSSVCLCVPVFVLVRLRPELHPQRAASVAQKFILGKLQLQAWGRGTCSTSVAYIILLS